MNHLSRSVTDPTSPLSVPQGTAVTEAALEQVRPYVERIVMRSRLWRDERNEVRLELLDHFRDGIEAGSSVEALIRDFGSPQVAARLIRQAKLRSRPLIWHVWHRALQILLCGLGVALTGVAVLTYLMVRLHTAPSGPLPDEVSALDRATAQIAETDRGWPEYREGLRLLDRAPLAQTGKAPALDLKVPPSDPTWKQVVAYLDANARSIDLFYKGAERSRLGYIYRDPANDAWLKTIKSRPSAELYALGKPRYIILLPHIQDLSHVRQLLEAVARRAILDRDLTGFQRSTRALSQLGRQIYSDAEFQVVQAIGQSTLSSALALKRQLISTHPELVPDEELQRHRDELAELDISHHATTSRELRDNFTELLDTSFTPPRAGRGRLTVVGCRYLQNRLWLVGPNEPLKFTALAPERGAIGLAVNPSDPDPEIEPDGLPPTWNRELAGIRWSTTLASREELQQEFDRLLAMLQRELDKPVWSSLDFERTPYGTEMRRMAADNAKMRRYWPVWLVLPTRDNLFTIERTTQIYRMNRDATLTTVALEQFRRRTGHWPAKLAELVPADQSQLPIDMFSGRPLKYRVVSGRRLLYSVYLDQDDDSGRPADVNVGDMANVDGDLRFLPVND